MDETKQPGIKCNAIILKRSAFERQPIISLKPIVRSEFSLDVAIGDDNKKSSVVVGCIIKFLNEKEEVFAQAEVEYLGLFEVDGQSENMDISQFSNNSAPAIIFPYVRNYIHNLTLLSGISQVIIPPVNIQAAIQKVLKK